MVVRRLRSSCCVVEFWNPFSAPAAVFESRLSHLKYRWRHLNRRTDGWNSRKSANKTMNHHHGHGSFACSSSYASPWVCYSFWIHWVNCVLFCDYGKGLLALLQQLFTTNNKQRNLFGMECPWFGLLVCSSSSWHFEIQPRTVSVLWTDIIEFWSWLESYFLILLLHNGAWLPCAQRQPVHQPGVQDWWPDELLPLPLTDRKSENGACSDPRTCQKEVAIQHVWVLLNSESTNWEIYWSLFQRTTRKRRRRPSEFQLGAKVKVPKYILFRKS